MTGAAQWTSALDRAAPLAGQLPAWQVDVGLYGDMYQPVAQQIIEEDPTCRIALQIAGAPVVYTTLDPCVMGPAKPNGLTYGFPGQTPTSPVPEVLTPNLAAVGNGPHTVTITAYDEIGGLTSSTTFTVDVDNTLPSSPTMTGPVGWQRGGEVVASTASTQGPAGIAGQ